MKATVITTGPGVIIAIAIASRNCRSFSQPSSSTTPPWRKGTIASPLPKTNAPAPVKNHAIFASTGQSARPYSPLVSQGATAIAAAVEEPRARAAITTAPAPRKSATSSRPVKPVTAASTANTAQSSLSFPRVRRSSLTTLRAISTSTAPPTPSKALCIHQRPPNLT